MNFDTWYDLYSHPYETREDAAERYADEQGYDNPAEKQGFLDSLPEYETITPLDQQAEYDYGFGDWTPPEEAPAPTVSADYEDDPSVWDSTKRGVDLAQASAFGIGEGAGAGFLEDIGLSDASKSLKDWSREGRLRNEAEAATVAPAKSIKEEVAANPDSWYKYLDEDMMTWGQMAEAAPTSLAPFAAALPLALATPYAAAAAGIAATGTLGSTLLSAGVAMGVGNVASSAFVSSEAYERGKNERVIREQLGVDPDKKFEDLLPSDQQKVDRVATDLSQTSFGHRLYTAGLVEMASYIPYGHAMVRLALDTGLGTASEVWDRTLYSEDAVDALIENGVPVEKAEELREAIIQAGPSFRETLIAAVQQEFVMGGAATGIESLVGKTAPQVNSLATATQEMKKEIKHVSELHDERKQKQIELDSKAQADREKQELREKIQRDQQDRKFYDASLLEELKQVGKEKTPKELSLEKEQQELDAMVPAIIEEDTGIIYEDVQELEGQQKTLEDSLVEQVSEPYKSIAEEKAERKRFDQNLPVSVADLNKQKKIIEDEQTSYKEGSDLKRGAKERLQAIDAKIKELTEIEAGKNTTKTRLQEKEAITKEEKVLANMGKKLYGIKGEKSKDRTFWSAEKFNEEKFYKKRKLELQQRKELANPDLQTQEQIERRKAIQREEIKSQATRAVDGTIKPSTIQSEGTFSFDKNFIQEYVDDLGKRFEKYKSIYTVLSNNSPQDLANVFLKAKHKNNDGSLMNREQATELAKKQLDGVNAFVYQDHVYVVAENIKGADKKAAMENLVKIVTFHEPITHLGLKEYLGDDYKPFLDNFYKTNKKDIQNWAETEALTEKDKTPAYLLNDGEQAAKEKGLTKEEVVEFRDNQNRDLAEEFLANKFVELGIADPDILTRTADSLLSVLKGIVDPLNKRISTVQARSVLAEVQRSYLGGKKNIITGSLFDPANWTMKGFEVEAGEDKVEAYRKYLKKQGIEYSPEAGTPEAIKSKDMASLKKPLEIEKTRKKSAVAVKKGTAELLKERGKKKARGITGDLPDVIYASKRTMTPRQAEVWKLKNKGKGKGRKPRNPALVALANKLETGKASYEEYRDKVNKLLPISKFKAVPKLASDSEILGSIDKKQYKAGLLLGEDTLTGKDIVNVRLDIPAYERYDSWVATITHGKDTIYGAAVRLKNVTFKAPPKGALRIAQGSPKTTLATMKGTWQGDSIANIEKMAKKYLDNPAWVQVGYNPERQSSFYLRENKTINGQEFEKGTPLFSADEVIQVGAFVLAKNVTTKATPSLTIGDVTLKYSKQQAINEKTNKNETKNQLDEFGVKYSKRLSKKDEEATGIGPVRGQGNVKRPDREAGESPSLGREFSSFFSSVTKGKKGRSTTGNKFKFITPSIVKESLKDSFISLNKTYKKHMGNFDDHIAHSIPAYRDIQMNVANAILATYKNQDTNMLDVGASEGALPKTITKLSKGKIKTVSLDPNLDMRARFNETPVDGAEFSDTAFSSEDTQGQNAWMEGNRQVLNYNPDREFDIIQEAMVFQFISNDRTTQIARIKGLLKDDGIAIIEEKVFLPANPEKPLKGINKVPDYIKNEEYKDDNYKSKFFTKAEMEQKKKEVLNTGQDEIEGMEKYMVPKNFLEAELLDNFKYVEQFWDSGNFKGYLASDSKSNLDTLSKNILDTNTEFSTATTPIAITDSTIDTFKFSKRSLTDEKTKTAEKADKGKTKGSNETRSSISGTTAKSPYEGRLDVELDNQSHFVHWSKSSDLIETDPSYYGTGIAGRERQKQKQYSDIFVPRTYIGLAGYRKEMGLGKNMYETNLDPTTLYDIESTDRLDLWEQAVNEMGFDKGAYSTRFEGLLKEAGYAGYFNKTHNVAVLFNPTKVNFTKEISGPSAYVPSIRGDQSIKASKRLDTPFDKELQKAEGKAEVAPPEKKEVSQKDKVTLSKEAKAILNAKPTRADLSPKAILDPDGNIKTSKILASRASMFALRSGDANTKGMPWRYRLADKLTKKITPQGTLPDRLKYLAIRRLIKGKVKGAEDASKALYNILKNTKQADVIYKYFTTRDFDANKIKNKAERDAAIGAKSRIDEIGEQLVKSDLLDEGAREQYKGMYLPQVYLKYLLKEGTDPFVKVRGGGGIQIDQNYLKKRLNEQELPKEVRELILGQIKDPAYLASKAISIPAKDMAILDWLQQIAGNEDWVAKDSLVSFDTLAEIRKAKLPLEAQKALELKDTKGVKVSGHWLKNESERIWGMTKYMNLDKTNTKIVEDLVLAMEKVSDKAFNTPYDPKLYSIVPKTKKYGMLAGMALRKEIANDIFGGMNMTTGDMSVAENILGDGGTLGSFNRFWKWSKVSANPPSWVRNFVSNMILMNMGGVSFLKMPFLIRDSLADMQGKGKYKGQLHQLARDLGLTAGNFSNIELGRIEREFKDLQIRMKNKGGPMGVIGMMKGAFNKVQDVTSDTYGGIDTLGKMMVLKHDLDKNKIKIKDLAEYKGAEKQTLDDIAYNAEKWLFDYSNVLPSVKYLRNVPFGAPFASFTSFVAPLMLETAITKPWKFLPYYALGYAMKEMFKDEFELDDDQYEGLKVSMSDYLREKAYGSIFPTAVIPFPYLDDNKRIQFMDVSYLYPWGMFSEMAGEIGQGDVGDAVKTAGLLGSPALNIASAIMTGIDPFTRREIVDETGSNSEKAADLIWYAWNLSAPPMLHGIWQGPGQGYGAIKRLKDAFTGELAKDGEARFTKGQAVGRMFGMNITPIAVPEGRNKHLRWEYSKHNKLIYRAKRELTNMLMMQTDMEEIKKEGKKWGKKILKSQEKFREKVKISVPPQTLLRERQKFLKEKRLSAQAYRASL